MAEAELAPAFGPELKVGERFYLPKVLAYAFLRTRSSPSTLGCVVPFLGRVSLSAGKVSGGIGWLEEIQQFYRERSLIEKEYSGRLTALARKYHEKKSKKTFALSVGDTPTLTPGSLER